MNLDAKVAIVTGGSTGIGFGIAQVLAQKGAKVVLAQVPSLLAQAQRAVEQLDGFTTMAVGVDIRDPKSIEAMVNSTLSHFGEVDILVNNAALTGMSAVGALLDCGATETDAIIDVNLKGTFYCSQAVARRMIEGKRGGSIVHVSSVGAYAAQELGGLYCATKAGIASLTKSMALEWAHFGVRVNAVAPGDIFTESSANIVDEMKRMGASGRFARVTPLGRRGEPVDIGYAVAFLASDESSFITGTTLVVDGGFLTY